jgi:hypothetical protein
MASENTPHVVSKEVQNEIDRLALEAAQIQKEIAVAELEQKRLQLDALKFSNEEAIQRKRAVEQKLINAKKSLERFELERKMKQAICNHTQGGEGLEGLYKGDGVQSTYQKETNSLGEEYYRCIRCEHTVTKQENPKEFKRIAGLPHKGLRGPIPVTFRFVDLKTEAAQ